MFKALKYFWKEQPLALAAFAIAVSFLLFFGFRTLMGFIYFQDPAHRNQALEAWMTPRYVSMSYRMPPDLVKQVLQIEDGDGRRIKLDEIAERQQVTLVELEKRVRQAAKEHRLKKAEEKAENRGKASTLKDRGSND